MTSFRGDVLRLIRSIPEGRVCSYGTVAELAGRPGAARAVGAVLRASGPEDALPWWRVVASTGRISTSRSDHTAQLQRALLEAEGVAFEETDRIDLRRFGWWGGEGPPPVS